MVFKVKEKVALVTGGAYGIGFAIAKELLNQGAKGVTIADINNEGGEKAVQVLRKEFGPNRAQFTLTDVRNSTSFENAFKETINKFNHIDILVNNAGICKDELWEKEIAINLNGTINGMILAMEKYLRNCKQGEEAVILNTASITACETMAILPIYSATKSGIVALTKCWGEPFHYDRVKVRVLAMCPGATDTAIFQADHVKLLNEEYQKAYDSLRTLHAPTVQSPEYLSKEAISLIEKAPNGSIWVIEEKKPAYKINFPNKIDFQNNTLS